MYRHNRQKFNMTQSRVSVSRMTLPSTRYPLVPGMDAVPRASIMENGRATHGDTLGGIFTIRASVTLRDLILEVLYV